MQVWWALFTHPILLSWLYSNSSNSVNTTLWFCILDLPQHHLLYICDSFCLWFLPVLMNSECGFLALNFIRAVSPQSARYDPRGRRWSLQRPVKKRGDLNDPTALWTFPFLKNKHLLYFVTSLLGFFNLHVLVFHIFKKRCFKNEKKSLLPVA